MRTQALTEGTCFGIVVGITFADNRICTPSPSSTYEQAAKAPPRIINEAVLDVFAAKNQAEREAIVDRKV